MNSYIEDKFTVTGVNKDGKYFKKVSRIDAKSEIYEIEMTLDINSEIYQMEKGKDYYVTISSAISSSDDEQQINKKMDEYQYVMYGKVFRITEERNGAELYINYKKINSYKFWRADDGFKRKYLALKIY